MAESNLRDEQTILERLRGNFSEQDAYRAGNDCGKTGPSLTNCDFRLFASPALTKAWEQGKAAAQQDQS